MSYIRLALPCIDNREQEHMMSGRPGFEHSNYGELMYRHRRTRAFRRDMGREKIH